MDVSEIGVKHVVAFTNLNVRHSFEVSPSTVSLAREIRIGLVAVVIGLTVATIAKTALSSRKPAS